MCQKLTQWHSNDEVQIPGFKVNGYTVRDSNSVISFVASLRNLNIYHGCMVWIEKSVTRVTDRHNEACRVMPNSDPE